MTTPPNLLLQTALADLHEAIAFVALGSIETVVMDAACRELISNWNDHHESHERIDTVAARAWFDHL